MVWVQTALAREEERCVENSAEGLYDVGPHQAEKIPVTSVWRLPAL